MENYEQRVTRYIKWYWQITRRRIQTSIPAQRLVYEPYAPRFRFGIHRYKSVYEARGILEYYERISELKNVIGLLDSTLHTFGLTDQMTQYHPQYSYSNEPSTVPSFSIAYAATGPTTTVGTHDAEAGPSQARPAIETQLTQLSQADDFWGLTSPHHADSLRVLNQPYYSNSA